MSTRPTIVCPVDFSAGSRAALNYAAVLANHFGARLLVVSVDDPLLVSAAQSVGLAPLEHDTGDELRRFTMETIPNASSFAGTLDFQVTAGKPAIEILRLAGQAHSDLIVISSHGRSGVGKLFFGTTTERVLRETATPVLVVPRDAEPVVSIAGITRQLKRVAAPVDLTAASPHQVMVAGDIARALCVPLLVAHVIEPVYVPPNVRAAIHGADSVRRADIETRLHALLESAGVPSTAETMVLNGDTSDEIVKLADARRVGLIVIGLHSSGLTGPRMGSVTYRVLCLTRAFVLALPPIATGPATLARAADTARAM